MSPTAPPLLFSYLLVILVVLHVEPASSIKCYACGGNSLPPCRNSEGEESNRASKRKRKKEDQNEGIVIQCSNGDNDPDGDGHPTRHFCWKQYIPKGGKGKGPVLQKGCIDSFWLPYQKRYSERFEMYTLPDGSVKIFCESDYCNGSNSLKLNTWLLGISVVLLLWRSSL